MNRNSNLIYFNNNRTTPQDDAVTECMQSLAQAPGKAAIIIEQEAKQRLADLLNAEADELIFTTGTSESSSLAMKGIYHLHQKKGNHIITNVTEHAAILDCCRELEQQGAKVTYLSVNREGLLDPEELKASITPATVLVSVMTANNETGVIQPVEKIAEICAAHRIHFFSDGSQAVGKIRCDVKELGMNSLAFSAHKMYGPAGIGLLYVDKQHGDLLQHISSVYKTKFSLPQIAGFGKAAELSSSQYWENSAHVSKLKNYFEHQLLDLDGLQINGSTRHRLYNTSNLSFEDGDLLVSLRERFDFADNRGKSSHVLTSMGLTKEEIYNSFRFSFGKYNTLDEVKLIVEEILGRPGAS